MTKLSRFFILLLVISAQARAEDNASEIKKLCESKAFAGVPLPKAKDEGTEEAMLFHAHCSLAVGKRAEGCDESLRDAAVYVEAAKKRVTDLYTKDCKVAKDAIDSCPADQAKSNKCLGEKLQALKTIFASVATDLDKASRKLEEKSANQRKRALAIMRADKLSDKNLKDLANKLELESLRGEAGPITHKEGGVAHTAGCNTTLKNQTYCSHITAATDTRYYANVLKKVQSDITQAADKFGAGAVLALGRGDSLSDDLTKKGGGLLDGMGGLDGLMKMATVGMMGAGLYCSVSGKCTPQKSTDADQNSSALAATSPTPASEKQDSTSLASAEKDASKGGTTGPTGTDSATSSVAGSNPFPVKDYSSDGSGFSNNLPDSSLAPFAGALDRQPASGGSASGGSDGSSGKQSENEPVATKPFEGGLGNGTAGGGLANSSFSAASAGSFNLGDTGTASPADAALKDILNGDALPGDPGLSSLLEGASAQGSGAADMQGEDSLFLRVRDTHTRCVKRGWVIQIGKENSI